MQRQRNLLIGAYSNNHRHKVVSRAKDGMKMLGNLLFENMSDCKILANQTVWREKEQGRSEYLFAFAQCFTGQTSPYCRVLDVFLGFSCAIVSKIL